MNIDSSQPFDDVGRDILVVTGGHRVDFDALFAMMTAICEAEGWRWAHVHQPTGQRWLVPERSRGWDAVLVHDIPGLRLQRGVAPLAEPAPRAVQEALHRLLGRGQGLVVTHHALAGWPSWEGWADALGGRFHYAPGRLHGREWPSSGTRVATYTAQVVAPAHPVCAGLDDFVLTDELYCCPVFEHEVVPLLRTDADMDGRLFTSTYEHVLFGPDDAPDCSTHPPASDLIAWANVAERSPVVYVQPGDSAATFRAAPYRHLLTNALRWVASPAAHEWAAGHPRPLRMDDDGTPDSD